LLQINEEKLHTDTKCLGWDFLQTTGTGEFWKMALIFLLALRQQENYSFGHFELDVRFGLLASLFAASSATATATTASALGKNDKLK
jgi:hypothetical protein